VVGFRAYDDGWRVVNGAVHSNQTIEEACEMRSQLRRESFCRLSQRRQGALKA